MDLSTRRRLLLAAAAILAASLALPFRPDDALSSVPLSEDGFYSLTIARNIAEGLGVTYDGVLPTNGFQPLVTFIQAGLFRVAGGDDVLALRLVLVLSWVVFGATAWVVAGIAGGVSSSFETLPEEGPHPSRRAPQSSSAGAPQDEDLNPKRLRHPEEAAKPPSRRVVLHGVVAATLYLASMPLWLHHFNGLETGLLLLLYALLWRAWQVGLPETIGGRIGCGMLLGLLVLARIDAAIFVAVLAVAEMAGAWRAQGPTRAVARAAVLAGTAFIVSLPWWLYNWIEFGSLMPISGTAQQLLALDPLRLRWTVMAIGSDLVPWVWVGVDWGSPIQFVPAILAALGVLAWRLRGDQHPHLDDRSRRSRRYAASLIVAMAVLAVWYCLSSFAFWFYPRYLAPLALPGIVLAAGLIAPRLRRRPALILVAPLLAAPVLAAAFLGWQGRGFYGTINFREQAALVAEKVPPGEWIAAGQSGTLGFVRAHVLNMDGKVNPEVHRWRERPWDYLRARDIRWFVDWDWYVRRSLGPEPERNGWSKVAERDKFLLYRYEGQD